MKRKYLVPYPCDNADGVPGYKLPVSDNPADDCWFLFKKSAQATAGRLKCEREAVYRPLRAQLKRIVGSL